MNNWCEKFSMNQILDAIDILVVNNCLTTSEALQKAYLAGHRAAAKELNKDKPEFTIVDTGKTSSARK